MSMNSIVFAIQRQLESPLVPVVAAARDVPTGVGTTVAHHKLHVFTDA